VERVTGIEPALSAWESDRPGLLTALTWTFDAPPLTVMDPVTPGLMARQWPVARWQGGGCWAASGLHLHYPAARLVLGMGWSKCRIRCLLSSLIAVTLRRQAEFWGQVLAHKMSRALTAGGASIAGSRPSERRCHPLWAMTPRPGEARVKRSDLDAWALGTTDAGKTMSEADVELGPVDYVVRPRQGKPPLARGVHRRGLAVR
jgi:hypothetical protein